MNTPRLPRRHSRTGPTPLAVGTGTVLAFLSLAAVPAVIPGTVPYLVPAAVAETGLNGMPREAWLPLTVDAGTPLPRDHALWTDDCRYDLRLPRAFDRDAARTADTPPVVTVQRPGPGGPGMESCGAVAATGVDLPERLSIGSYVLYDVDTGDVLASKDPYGLYRPASVIKILLVMVALDELDPDHTVPVTGEMANVDGSKVGVGPGGRYTARQLLQGLVMNSGNDAALALAGALGGEDATVAKMQALADSLGTRATRVTTVNGLDTPESQTTAYDLALVYRAAFLREDVRTLLGTRQATFPGFGENPAFQISSDNGLLHDYPGTIGGKTGFTDNARHTYAAAVSRDGRTYGVVMLNATLAAGRPWVQAEGFFDAAFSATEKGTGSGTESATVGQLSGPDSGGSPAEVSAATASGADPTPGFPPAPGTSAGGWADTGTAVAAVVGAVLVTGMAAITGLRWMRRRRIRAGD
ncbi:MAG: serine hydrolase [Corynebacterium provencense]|uniref:D-alanyl-D-alanine carboxypeptidase family protein n=1 Tax=Corynebacterium provencense TaxID=1737425 RepID=UPI002989F89C|nr:serine hydrolase [Corynebacterium provencense]